MHGAAYVHFSTNLQTIQLMNSSMYSYIAEMPAILDNFIYQLVNTSSTSIRVGVGVVGSRGVAGGSNGTYA